MDKNMISIDDLVKQRLSGGEEKERPGAWLQMRELLDKEQPVRIAAGYNWKRMLTYAAGLLLLATASVGGYRALYSVDTEKNDIGNAAMSSKHTGILSSINEENNYQDLPVEPKANATSVASTKELPKVITEKTATNRNKQNNTGLDNEAIARSENKAIEKTATNRNKLYLPATLASNTTNDAAINQSNITPNKKVNTVDNKKLSQTDITALSTGSKNTAQKPASTATVAAIKYQTTTLGANYSSNASSTQNTARPQLSPEQTNPRYRKTAKVVDSIDMIATRESNKKGFRKIDTISTGKIATEKYNAGNEDALAAQIPSDNIVPAAAIKEDAEGNLEPLANHKTDSKKLKNKNYNPRRFEEMVQNAKLNLSGVSFHSGLMAGISSSVGAYNMMGAQFGIAGMMNINERWGMFAELKYIYRFGNGKSLINNYNRLTNSSYLGNNTYNHNWDSVEHYFNITSTSSLELPIAVRYAVKRLNIFAGINTAYNFSVNVDEKENAHARDYITTGSSTSGLTSQWDKDYTKITYDDFASRFTMGYLLGLGYQVSPAVGFDIRATQPLWDNVKTKGAYQVSKELFRNPSFQINFTYRLSSNKYKPRTR